MSQPPSDSPQPPRQPAGQPPVQPPPQGPYPSPYPQTYPPTYAPTYSPETSFWPYYLRAPDDLLRPARRASLMLFLLAALLLLAGTCVGVVAMAITDQQMNEALAEAKRMNPQQAAMLTPHVVRTGYGALGVFGGMLGVVAIILAIVVRSGRRASTITALVLVGLFAAGLGLMLLMSLAGGPSGFLATLLVMVLPIVLVAMTVMSLVQAIRAAPELEAAERQMQLMHQHQTAQYQAYAQQGQWPPQT